MKLEELKDKKILSFELQRENKVLSKAKVFILGFGREGKNTFLFLRKLFPNKTIGIADQKNLKSQISNLKNVRMHFGKDYLKAIKKYDIIIKSPGIPFKILPKSALKKIITQTDIFFDNCKGQIVGITGTKGKSTTTSMIYEILKAGGFKAHLVGNIGKPVLNLLFSAGPKDIYVYELSSHQLFNLRKSPPIAVFLNIFPEHLDYYRNFNEYIKAKANIALHQTKNDFLIFNSQDKIVSQIARKSKAKKIEISGEYYELDRNAARAVGKIFKIPERVIKKSIKSFKPLPHRLELVGTFKGITFYNDALSTIPETAIMAMKNLGKKVETVMLGGFDRNISFEKLAGYILENENIKNLILFPTTGEKIWQNIVRQSRGEKEKLPKHFYVDNMKGAVKLAYQHTQKGKICLLSTASTSFSIFRDYREKGDLFKKYVRELARGKK